MKPSLLYPDLLSRLISDSSWVRVGLLLLRGPPGALRLLDNDDDGVVVVLVPVVVLGLTTVFFSSPLDLSPAR